MLACKGIFAKPSITQPHIVRDGQSPKACVSKAFCVYYINISTKKQDLEQKITPKQKKFFLVLGIFRLVQKGY